MSVDNLSTSKVSGQYSPEQVQEILTTARHNFAKVTGMLLSSSFGVGTSGMSGAASADSDLPELDAPVTTSMGFCGLSLESLVSAIGNTERKQACAEGVDRLERRAEKVAENNDLKLKEMADNLELLKKQEKLGPFQKAFQWIGAVLGVVASAITVGVGVATGNPMLIAAGVIGMVMAVDNVVSLATDGKVSISAGITEFAKVCGASEDTAKWIALGFQLALAFTAAALSFGAAYKGLTGAVKVTTETLNFMNKTQSVMQIVSGTNTIASASAGIASTVYNYETTMNQADILDLQAVLEQIKMAQEFEEAMIKAEMERSNALLQSVNDIISESNSTAMTIMGGAPAMV